MECCTGRGEVTEDFAAQLPAIQDALSTAGAIWHQDSFGAQMNRSTRAFSLIAAAVLILNLAACSITRQWNVTGGDRSAGVVRVSYEYPEFEQRKLSDEQAMQIATSRCNGWGYE